MSGRTTREDIADSQPRHARYNVRHHDRLATETSPKLEELAAAFHRKLQWLKEPLPQLTRMAILFDGRSAQRSH
jgi:hypothetical protein